MPNIIEDYLESLPSTKEGVIALLREKGIKGKRCESCSCPIFKLLRSVNHNVDMVSMTRVWVDLQFFLLPASVTEFIDNFDDGKYPEFIETSTK